MTWQLCWSHLSWALRSCSIDCRVHSCHLGASIRRLVSTDRNVRCSNTGLIPRLLGLLDAPSWETADRFWIRQIRRDIWHGRNCCRLHCTVSAELYSYVRYLPEWLQQDGASAVTCHGDTSGPALTSFSCDIVWRRALPGLQQHIWQCWSHSWRLTWTCNGVCVWSVQR